MLYMVSEDVKKRLLPVLKRVGLPVTHNYKTEDIILSMMHDKKIKGNKVSLVLVNETGKGEIKDIATEELIEKVRLYK